MREFEHRRPLREDWVLFFADNRPEIAAAMRGARGKAMGAERFRGGGVSENIHLNDKSAEKTVKIINAIASVMPDAKTHGLVIPGPHYVWGFRSPRYSALIDRFKAELAPAIDAIDLHGQTMPSMHLLHDGHWNEVWHRYAAEMVASRL